MIEETITQPESLAEVDERPTTILVVDDDESQLIALEYRLQQQGYRVLTALTGTRAYEVAMEELPDLVVLDLRLPDRDGFDVCAQLADHPKTCGTPIIIVSAVERPDIVRKARSVGSAYYVRKPYDPNVLLTLIQQGLREAQSLDW